MNRCKLCGRLLLKTTNCYGPECLRKMSLFVGMDDKIKKENKLNDEIEEKLGKNKLNKAQKQILTNRYLTFKLLKDIDIDYYIEITKTVENDIKKINKETKANEVKSNKIITLKEAYEIYKLYNRYKKFKDEVNVIINNNQFDKLQNIVWDTVLFAYNIYYNKKPYLTTLTQHVQMFIWNVVINLARVWNLNCGADFLEHSLNEKPQDKYIISGLIVDKIKEDSKFKNKIKEIIAEYGAGDKFDTLNKEYLNYESMDLFFALNNTNINVKGRKLNKKWILVVTITDTYDFTDFKEIGEYYSGNIIAAFIGSVTNNVAMLSTACNVMNEYNITIKFSMEV